MTILVTASLYSGLPSPTWELPADAALQLTHMLEQPHSQTFVLSGRHSSILGYRGFIVKMIGADAPSPFYCFNGVIDFFDQPGPNFVDKDARLESFLLQTAGTQLTEREHTYIASAIAQNLKAGPGSAYKQWAETFALRIVPPYNPGKWNTPSVQPNNNCYNYANDKITNTFAQPGVGSGYSMKYPPVCDDVTKASVSDRQISVGPPASTPAEGHFIALVTSVALRDYHWYRLDSNGKWSHKQGTYPATNLDHVGREIADPRTCNRGPYDAFCGFFHCIPARTTIR